MGSASGFSDYEEPGRYDPSYRVYGNALFNQSSSRIDEGYSEDVRSQDGSEMETGPAHALMSSGQDGMDVPEPSTSTIMKLMLSQPEELRAHFAFSLLQSCRTTQIANVVEKLQHRLHHDPVVYLPPELMFSILEYLPPLDLLNAVAVSKLWRNRALDSRLWQSLYAHEGWTYNHRHVQFIEKSDTLKQTLRMSSHDRNRNPAEGRRSAGSNMHSIPGAENSSKTTTPIKSGRQHAYDETQALHIDTSEAMQDITYHDSPSTIESGRYSASADSTMDEITDQLKNQSALNSTPKSPLFLRYPNNQLKANWHYAFNLRRRLERNWDAGRFKNFRLPHIDYPHEAHSQCVYTIQYSSNHLVSGSRDQTVRVWNLETQRLMYSPLLGHTGSVLCLQFDDNPDQDVIISGGSDADIIVWQFSTGKLVKRIAHAHLDSVLNLRFDDRYLVTCSKDKTIKVWNRKALSATDAEYPATDYSKKKNARYPDYIINNRDLNKYPGTIELPPPLDPYSLLLTFDGHGAAVNAIQIYKDQIVSASGDRKIKVWDIPNGREIKTLAAHQKGIACVQYDGRRIVTGSSDNTVKIFDVATGAEVAVLEGHTSLVRSVQAEFGDAPGDEIQQAAEARANDQAIIALKMKELSEERRPFEARSPHKYFVFGAKLPPGGGGNRWTKIVSGSYDETLIIWKRDKTGRWFIAKQLRQEEAIRSTGGPLLSSTPSRHQTAYNANLPPNAATPQGPQPVGAPQNQAAAAALAVQQAHRAQLHLIRQHARQQWPNQPGIGANQYQPPTPWMPGQPGTLYGMSTNTASQASGGPVSSVVPASQLDAQDGSCPPQISPDGSLQDQQSLASPVPLPTLPAQPPQPQHPTAAQNPQHHHNNAAHHHPGVSSPAPVQAPMNRVFKLQFDARRIICCSQEPVIIGWDFANGDKELIEASQFFGEPKG